MEIYLMNGHKISMNIVSTDQTDDVLEVTLSAPHEAYLNHLRLQLNVTLKPPNHHERQTPFRCETSRFRFSTQCILLNEVEGCQYDHLTNMTTSPIQFCLIPDWYWMGFSTSQLMMASSIFFGWPTTVRIGHPSILRSYWRSYWPTTNLFSVWHLR